MLYFFVYFFEMRFRLVCIVLLLGLPFVNSCGIQNQTAETEASSGSDPAMAGAALKLIAEILKRGGLQVANKAVQKAFTERAAHQTLKILTQYRMDPTQVSGALQQLNRAACFSIHLAGQLRVVLTADKSTVLFAGSHEAYNNFLKSSALKSLCGGR